MRKGGTRSAYTLGRIVLLALLVVAALPLSAHAGDDYSDADYREHDLDNYTRARGRLIGESTDPSYHPHFASACADSTGRSVTRQASEARFGRIYGSVGYATCWWSVGHAPDYFAEGAREVRFLSRSGAKLSGHLWGTDAPGPRPGVVITTGSIQASEEMYWWAARALAAAGYVVLTWDVQGQGRSESVGHAPGSTLPDRRGVPSQQDFNFHEGTIDALRFFLSTPSDEYVPQGWSNADVAAAKTSADGERVDWSNPGWGVLDPTRLGIAGHSLGARAVSVVQQCSDMATLWQTVPLCGGRSFPIRAVVAWDALNPTPTPVVPAMDQRADGYFLFPTFSSSAPDPTSSLAGFERWKSAGKDVFMYVVRGGTHIEWSQTPYTSATRYGVFANSYYTVAWMDRWVHGDAAVRQTAYEALTAGPKADETRPWAANYFSARRYSAISLRAPGNEAAATGDVDVFDVRAWAGRSAVRDWAGANADGAGRILP